jgi:two-component system, NtrC family, sensor kinase
MGSEVSTSREQQDLVRSVAELERELGEAHRREAATAELLQVVNRPNFRLQSVFDAIAQSAGRLCEAEFASVFRFDGKLLSVAASCGLTPEGLAAWQKELPRPAAEDTAIGRATLQRAIVQIPDVQADAAYGVSVLAQVVTFRSIIAVPFLRDGHPI